MEMEAEHYTNGVVEGSTQIMNGSYNHEEMLQDDLSMGNGIKGNTHSRVFIELDCM